MNIPFGESLRRLRTERGLSQEQLAAKLHTSRASVANWETMRRMPDISTVAQLSEVLGADVGWLLRPTGAERPNVILVDDNKVMLSGALAVLEESMPSAAITGFIWPSEAIEYAKTNPVALAVLDIELGTASGLDLSRRLTEINPQTNVVFLTAYPDYALDAWETEASGFLVKPLTPARVREQLKKLRYPFSLGGADE